MPYSSKKIYTEKNHVVLEVESTSPNGSTLNWIVED